MKVKRTVYLVTDYGGEWEDAWEFPYMAFENEHDAEVCAEKRSKRNQYDGKDYPETIWDEYCFSKVVAITVLMEEKTCRDVADFDREPFKCSECGYRVLSIGGKPDDAKLVAPEGGVVDFGCCPNCHRKVVE